MSIWNWLSLFGVPAIVAGVVISLWVQTKAIKEGVQALLRDRLIQGYRYFGMKKYADIDDRSNLENIYTQYHALGQNGVMDDLRAKFLALPLKPNDERRQTNEDE